MQAIFTWERMYFILKLSSNSLFSLRYTTSSMVLWLMVIVIGNRYPSNSIVDLDLRFSQLRDFRDDNFQCNLQLHALLNNISDRVFHWNLTLTMLSKLTGLNNLNCHHCYNYENEIDHPKDTSRCHVNLNKVCLLIKSIWWYWHISGGCVLVYCLICVRILIYNYTMSII
jgi:hypothetical protein